MICSKLSDITQDEEQACDMLGFPVNPRKKFDEGYLAAVRRGRNLSAEAVAENAVCFDMRTSFALYGRSPVRHRDARGQAVRLGWSLVWGLLWVVAASQ